MFGKTEKKNQSLPDVKITKMPDDFYAGTNPIIKFQTVEKVIKSPQIEKSILSSADKILLDKKTAMGAGNKLHPINLFANWKFLIVAGLGILIIGGSIIGFYYWWQYRKAMPVPQEPVQPVVTEPIVQSIVPEITSTSTAISEPIPTTIPVVSTEVKLDIPSSLLGNSIDTDQDDITDIAEGLFDTDPSVPDTDDDKFPDGHEVFYLYNPAGKEPMKLIDSGLVNVYANPAFLYKIFYPKSWVVGNVDINYKDVLFSTLSGENIEVRVMDMNPGETFNDWFSRNANNEQLADYLPFESVFKQAGFARKDNLVYFFPKGNQVFAVLYHTTDSSVVNYRIVIKMLARSFQFGNSTDLPIRPVEESSSSSVSL